LKKCHRIVSAKNAIGANMRVSGKKSMRGSGDQTAKWKVSCRGGKEFWVRTNRKYTPSPKGEVNDYRQKKMVMKGRKKGHG